MALRVAVFIDYEDARHYAARQSGGSVGDFDPWDLATAICELSNERGTVAAQLELAEVRVYLGASNQFLSPEDFARYKRLRTAWKRRPSVAVQMPRFRTKKDRIVKEHHTQMSIDLFNWALDVSSGGVGPEVAVLFSADRDCAPIVRRLATCFGSGASPRVDLAGWLEHDGKGQPLAYIVPLKPPEDRTVNAHLLRWADCEI